MEKLKKLKKIKTISLIAVIVLGLVSCFTDQIILFYIAMLGFVGIVIQDIIFYRCPHCRYHLGGRRGDKVMEVNGQHFCQHCNHILDD